MTAAIAHPRWTPRQGPACLCVGMPKCGTSTFHALLEGVPPFFVPTVKEINFFAYDRLGYHGAWRDLAFGEHWIAEQERRTIGGALRDMMLLRRSWDMLPWTLRYLVGRRDEAWYLSLFPPGRFGVDASPVYHSLTPDEIARVRRVAPDARIIILLRDPLEQLWSHCRMIVVGKKGSKALADLNAHLDRQLAMRRSYAGLVSDWRAAYGERVLVGAMDEMTATPVQFLQRVLVFFDLDAADAPLTRHGTGAHVNAGVPLDVPEGLRAPLAAAARTRLEGFEAVDAALAEKWLAAVESFATTASAESA